MSTGPSFFLSHSKPTPTLGVAFLEEVEEKNTRKQKQETNPMQTRLYLILADSQPSSQAANSSSQMLLTIQVFCFSQNRYERISFIIRVYNQMHTHTERDRLTWNINKTDVPTRIINTLGTKATRQIVLNQQLKKK